MNKHVARMLFGTIACLVAGALGYGVWWLHTHYADEIQLVALGAFGLAAIYCIGGLLYEDEDED